VFEPKRRPIEFQGTGVVDHPATEASGKIRNVSTDTEDRFRAGCYGEALLAFSKYLHDDVLSPPSSETLATLRQAYDGISGEFEAFTREDFTLYAMSILHQRFAGESPDHLELRRGAARYLLDVKPRLSPRFQSLSDDAQAFLAKEPLESIATENPDRSFLVIDNVRDDGETTLCETAEEPRDMPARPTPEPGPRKRDMPYRRLDLARANRPASTSAEPIRHALPQQARPSRRAATQKSHAALAILFTAIVSGTALFSYIALSLLFAD
jgi:hypothetical protein